MAEERFMPCADWIEKLSFSPEDLSPSDRAALDAHVATCPTCLLVRIDDGMINRLLNKLPPPDFGVGLPLRLKQLLREDDCQEKEEQEAMLLANFENTVLEVVSERKEEDAEKPAEPESRSKNKEFELGPPPPVPSVPTLPSLLTPRPKEHFNDMTFVCRECGQNFVFTAGEQEFYQQKGLMNRPSRCPDCRARRRAVGENRGRSERAPREMHTVICAECGNETQVPFLPKNDRPVYCSDCFMRMGTYTQNKTQQT